MNSSFSLFICTKSSGFSRIERSTGTVMLSLWATLFPISLTVYKKPIVRPNESATCLAFARSGHLSWKNLKISWFTPLSCPTASVTKNLSKGLHIFSRVIFESISCSSATWVSSPSTWVYGCHLHKGIQCEHELNSIWVSHLDCRIWIKLMGKFLAIWLWGKISCIQFIFCHYRSADGSRAEAATDSCRKVDSQSLLWAAHKSPSTAFVQVYKTSFYTPLLFPLS